MDTGMEEACRLVHNQFLPLPLPPSTFFYDKTLSFWRIWMMLREGIRDPQTTSLSRARLLDASKKEFYNLSSLISLSPSVSNYYFYSILHYTESNNKDGFHFSTSSFWSKVHKGRPGKKYTFIYMRCYVGGGGYLRTIYYLTLSAESIRDSQTTGQP